MMTMTMVATMAATKNAISIWTLVKRMNHLLRLPDLSSPVDSAQPTEPAGYSPPMPADGQSLLSLNVGRIKPTNAQEETVRDKSCE